MKNFLSILILLLLFSCTQKQVHPPVGGILSQKDINVSKNRAKALNITERLQIQDWIKTQKTSFYSMGLNYWIDKQHLDKRFKKPDGYSISYEYDLYDFDKTKLYEKPTVKKEVRFGSFDELKAVEDALRYLEKGENATLLVPSVLAFGTYGDNDKIPNDMPLIIELRVK